MQRAEEIIQTYDGRQPLQLHLKHYFKSHPEMGSRDRKLYTALAYGYFRCKGKRPHAKSYIVQAAATDPLLHAFYSYWHTQINIPVDSSLQHIFPMEERISASVDKTALEKNLQVQAAVFIRIREAHLKEVLDELNTVQYTFTRQGNCIRFETPHALQELETFQKGYFEIQDIASQSTGSLFYPQKNEAWWDCCAGSGGKTLMLLEAEKQIQLFVSDNRLSILNNLHERLSRIGVTGYASLVISLEEPEASEFRKLPQLHGIIADVPCTGSGTWSGSPERMAYCSLAELEMHVLRQQKILKNIVTKLLPGAALVYLTCSVFADENEMQVAWMEHHLKLRCERQEYFQHSAQRGSTMFGAVMRSH